MGVEVGPWCGGFVCECGQGPPSWQARLPTRLLKRKRKILRHTCKVLHHKRKVLHHGRPDCPHACTSSPSRQAILAWVSAAAVLACIASAAWPSLSTGRKWAWAAAQLPTPTRFLPVFRVHVSVPVPVVCLCASAPSGGVLGHPCRAPNYGHCMLQCKAGPVGLCTHLDLSYLAITQAHICMDTRGHAGPPPAQCRRCNAVPTHAAVQHAHRPCRWRLPHRRRLACCLARSKEPGSSKLYAAPLPRPQKNRH